MKLSVTFKGNNYLVWSRMVRTAVGSKGLWKHITPGEAPKLITQGEEWESDSSEALEKLEQEDCMVCCQLFMPPWNKLCLMPTAIVEQLKSCGIP